MNKKTTPEISALNKKRYMKMAMGAETNHKTRTHAND